MAPCGDQITLLTSTYQLFRDAVSALQRVGTSRYNFTADDTAASVAVFDVIANVSGSVLLADLNASGLFTSPAQVDSFYSQVSSAVPASLVAQFKAAEIFEEDANMTRRDGCRLTYANRSAWQRMATVCGFTCDIPTAGRFRMALRTYGATDEEGRPTVTMFL